MTGAIQFMKAWHEICMSHNGCENCKLSEVHKEYPVCGQVISQMEDKELPQFVKLVMSVRAQMDKESMPFYEEPEDEG